MSEDTAAQVDGNAEPSGTAEVTPAAVLSPEPNGSPKANEANEETPLDWQEVIQLQAFSERKVWIEEKIDFLEKLPPIEVFVGLDAVKASADIIPGLPTRDELKKWMQEHDKIEKEIMIFDSGELKKLREVTKAASKRNLSPEDTDLIELTLTTIYQLDKLLHLLRNRTEHLDLLATRLTWEEQRVAAWVDYRQIILDLQDFLEGRARWQASIYDQMTKIEETPGRRGSVSSMTSVHSEASGPVGFSRGARFKQAETLSREAAQLAGRVSSLRHGKIAAAGKMLDKLIDTSRRAVPDELLDEQDHLETKGITEMENLGKFAMTVVMQWKKADEIYVESVKDQTAAQTLIEEIMSARRSHPTSRQAAIYASRVDAITKRLQMRTNPMSPISTFPRPSHPLYPEQKTINDSIAQSLSDEIKIALEINARASALVRDYSDTLAAVKRVEAFAQVADDTSSRLSNLIDRLTNGVVTSDGDGSPPDLTTETCLEAQRHEVFLALSPSLLEDLAGQRRVADEHLANLRAAMAEIDSDCLDPAFVASVTSRSERLAQQSTAADEARSRIEALVSLFRDVRKVWMVVTQARQTMEETWRSMKAAMLKDKYISAIDRNDKPLTPESPVEEISLPSLDNIGADLDSLGIILDQTIPSLLSPLSQAIDAPLYDWIDEELSKMSLSLKRMRDMCRVWQIIQAQANAMTVVRDDVNDLQIRIEDFKTRYDSMIRDVLAHEAEDTQSTWSDSPSSLQDLQESVQTFTNSLVQRVPLIGSLPPLSSPVPSSPASRRRTGSPPSRHLRWDFRVDLPLDATVVDSIVRTDLNLYSMRLAGETQALLRTKDHYEVAKRACTLDVTLSVFAVGIADAESALDKISATLESLPSSDIHDNAFDSLADQVEKISQSRAEIKQSVLAMQNQVHEMESIADKLDSVTYDTLITARKRRVDDALEHSISWNAKVESLRRSILQAQRVSTQRKQEEQLAEAKRLQEERYCLEAERAAQEALEAERRRQEEQEAEATRVQEERDRLDALCAAQKASEAERKRQEEAETQRLQEERNRLEAERAARDALEGERRREEERLAEVKRLQEEGDRIEADRAAQEDLEAERRRQEELAEAEAKRLQEERHRLEADRAAQEALEAEQKMAESLSLQGKEAIEDYGEQTASAGTAPMLGAISEDADVFGLQVSSPPPVSLEILDLQAKIFHLRKRLRALSLDRIARPSTSNTSLPTEEDGKHLTALFSNIMENVNDLPTTVDNAASAELNSLQADVRASKEMLERIKCLVELSASVQDCDNSLSDLLEHIDSYPAPPAGPLLSAHISQTNIPPEEQLLARVNFAKAAIADMQKRFAKVSDDSRAVAENSRLLQTWAELEEMSNDRLAGTRSRPPSVVSSGRNSSVSMTSSSRSSAHRKGDSYSNLSTRSSRGRHLAPPILGPNRSTSSTSNASCRSSSRLSIVSTQRSVSGPQVSSSSTLYKPTFASRQRTMSTASNSSTLAPPKPAPATPSRPRAQTGGWQRRSPTMSDASSHRSTASMSTWSRRPRDSFSSLRKVSTSRSKIPQMVKKPYIPNPKNKLDVAVGDVVNNLPVNINIEVVADTWKDQSGKYWIGDQEPKLCFCRILRSQTVMVRVGGGWTELSKFIKNHFADLFRLMPESPPGTTSARAEKWISSKILLETTNESYRPQTPESKETSLPTFALSTPSGRSTHSIKTTSSPGSPLTPLQFMRRAEGMERPVTPTKRPPSTPATRPRKSIPNTPARAPAPVWRP